MSNGMQRLWTCAAVAALAGCGGGSNDPQNTTGTLTLALMDAPVDNVLEIWVEIAGVAVKPQGNGPALDFDFATPVQVDLLALDADNSEMLLDNQVLEAGAYNWIELKVNASFDGNLDSYVVTDNGGVEEIELEIPGGSNTGLRLVSGFTITANQETSFLIDWDMRLGLKRPPGRPGYMLRPAFRIIDMTAFGTMAGTVAADLVMPGPPTCTNDLNEDTGNVVYVFEGFDVEADDIDGVDDPVATINVRQNAGEYTYEALLSPGEYSVAFTCQASSDDPEADETSATPIEFVLPVDPNVTIEDGVTTTVDFN